MTRLGSRRLAQSSQFTAVESDEADRRCLEGGARRLDAIEFVAPSRALGLDPVKASKQFIDGSKKQ